MNAFAAFAIDAAAREYVGPALINDAFTAFATDKSSWAESYHPRGQPDNAGQFSSGGGGASKADPAPSNPFTATSSNTGTEFVSPDVSENLSLTKAIKAVASPRHAMLFPNA